MRREGVNEENQLGKAHDQRSKLSTSLGYNHSRGPKIEETLGWSISSFGFLMGKAQQTFWPNQY